MLEPYLGLAGALNAGDLDGVAAAFETLGAPVDLAAVRTLIRRIDPRYMWAAPGQAGSDGDVTCREQQVLDFVIQGLTNKEIGTRLHMSLSTTKRHITALMRYYDVTSRRELAQIARTTTMSGTESSFGSEAGVE